MFLGMDFEKVVRLTESLYESNVVVGAVVTKEEISVKLCKRGSNNFESVEFELDDTNVVGYYKLTISKNCFDQEGDHTLLIQGPAINDHVVDVFMQPYPLAVDNHPGLCTIVGSVLDLSGNAPLNADITFKIVDVPKRIGEALIAAKTITTKPDAYGNFSVKLVCGATVLVEIPTAGIKNNILIPDQTSAQLTELLPERP